MPSAATHSRGQSPRNDKGGSRHGRVLNQSSQKGLAATGSAALPPGDSCAGSSGAETSQCPLKGGGGREKPVLLPPAGQTSPRNPGPRVSVFSLPREWGGGCQVFGRNHVQVSKLVSSKLSHLKVWLVIISISQTCYEY